MGNGQNKTSLKLIYNLVFISKNKMTEEIVINIGYGGFGLSELAQQELGGAGPYAYRGTTNRNNPDLVAVVKKLGNKASGECSDLVIQIAPKGGWALSEYDGLESIVFPTLHEWEIKKLVFDESKSDTEKISELKSSYEKADRNRELFKTLRKQNEALKKAYWDEKFGRKNASKSSLVNIMPEIF